MKTKLLTICLLLNTILCFGNPSFKCTVKGTIINRDSKVLYLTKASDARDANRQVIDIKDNAFEYTFDVTETEAYQLIFKDEIDHGSWHPVIFFPVGGGVSFKIYDMENSGKNEVTGGKLNKELYNFLSMQKTTFDPEYKALKDKEDILTKNHEYRSAAYDSVIAALNNKSHDKVDRSVYLKLAELRKTGDEYTPKGKLLSLESKAIARRVNEWKYAYINKNVNEFSYYLMLQDAFYSKDRPDVAEEMNKAYPAYAAKFPQHSYTKIIGNELNSLFKIKVGQQIMDLTASDLSGRSYQLSGLSKGKITLIDLWGSWCGPCISATRTMLPIYNEFKDKGFTLVGIAREFKSTNDLANALKREKYPWVNLVELDDKNEIWNKFGISNGAGMMVLVDKDGKIIAINPTDAEVKKAIIERT